MAKSSKHSHRAAKGRAPARGKPGKPQPKPQDEDSPMLEEVRRRAGRLLSLARRQRGLTAAELGALVGVSQPRVSQLEAGQNLEIGTLARLAEALGLELRVGLAPRGGAAGFPSELLVQARDIAQWAEQVDAATLLPDLLRRLILNTTPQLQRVELPGSEAVRHGGYDGVVEAGLGSAFVPGGASVWELSVSKDPKGKAERDYAARTRDPLGQSPAHTAYVAVTARRWPGKKAWVQEKLKEGKWREVRAYDADDLFAWLEIDPATHIWFSRRLGKYPEHVRDLEGFWEAWSGATVPAVHPGLVTAGRAREVERVHQWLQGPPSLLTVQAQTREEVVAFLAASLRQLENPEPYLARAVVVEDLAAWRQLAGTRKGLVLVALFDERGEVGCAAGRHWVYVPLGQDDGAVSETLRLPLLDLEGAQKALEAMGFKEEDARNKAREARSSLEAFRRSLSPELAVQPPLWAREAEVRPLLAALLAGSWTEREADQQALSQLAGMPYPEVQHALTLWLGRPDAPVRRVGDEWMLASREDAWRWLHRRLTPAEFEAFRRVALEVLGEDDPKLDLPPGERYLAGVMGKVLRHSDLLRRGLAETLALMGARSEASELQGGRTGQQWADRVVRDLLAEGAGWRRWASLGSLLPLLAEASPDEFLRAVERGLQGEAPPLLQLFTDHREDGSLFGPQSHHTGLLWALENLAWPREYLGEATLHLARLAELDPGGRLGNRPHRSLAEIFCFWLPQTVAPLQSRLRVLERVIKSHPAVGWRLLMDLLPTVGQASGMSHRPRFRDWGVNPHPQVPLSEVWEAAEWAVDRLLRLVGNDGGRWSDLLEALPKLPHGLTLRVVEQLEGLDPAGFRAEDRARVWGTLRELIGRYADLADTEWSLPPEQVKRLQAVYERFEPEGGLERYAWLFGHNPRVAGIDRRDWQVRQEALARLRRDAVARLYREGGLEAVFQLAARVECFWEVGLALSRLDLPPDEEARVFAALGSEEPWAGELARHYVMGRAEAKGDEGPAWLDELHKLAQGWNPVQQARFYLCLPFGAATWDRLEAAGPEAKALYWRWVGVYQRKLGDAGEVERAVRSFLEAGRPRAAVDFLLIYLQVHHAFIDELPLALAVEALQQLAQQPEAEGGSLLHGIDDLLDVLERAGLDESSVARLEIMFFGWLEHVSDRPKTLYRLLAKDPDVFHEVLTWVYAGEGEDPQEATEQAQHLGRLGYRILRGWYGLPGGDGEGGVDPQALLGWVARVRELARGSGRAAAADYQVGEVLSRSPLGSDGVWPHEAVREVLEGVRSEPLAQGFIIGRLNRQGGVMKDPLEGGAQELQIAQAYRRDADLLAEHWPRTTRLLRELADSYESDARREESEAELRRSLWW